MNRAIDVAYFVINYANDHKYNISNLKLQKLLYYIQAAFLLKSEGKELCFSDRINAWLHGPVVETVYYSFSKFGGKPIPKQNYVEKVVLKDRKLVLVNQLFAYEILAERDRKIVENVLDQLLRYEAWDLVNRTHEEDPWKSTKPDEEITPECIYAYFRKAKNGGRIYGNFNM